MKNKVAVIGILLLCLIPPAFAQTSSGDVGLVLKDIQIPSDIYPGDSFNISFRLENSWYGTAREIYTYLEGGYPLLNVSPTEPQYIRILGFEYNRKTSDPLYFNLSVDKSASAGSYTVDVVMAYRRYSEVIGLSGGYERFRETIPILIKVKGRPDIEIFVKSSQPSEIRAGDSAEIRLEAVNTGTEEARNVLILSDSIEEMEVLWSSRTVYVGDIAPQESKTAAVAIDVKEDIDAGEYGLPIKVVYETLEGENVAVSKEINVVVEESVEFDVSPVASSVGVGEKEKMITFEVQNSGNDLAEEVKATLRASYPFTPTGNEFFIGELQPGESAHVTFHINVDSDAAPQKYPVDIIVQWTEDDQEYTETKSSFIDVTPVEEKWQVYAALAGGIIALLVILARIKKS